jgi:hypothetical protein
MKCYYIIITSATIIIIIIIISLLLENKEKLKYCMIFSLHSRYSSSSSLSALF